MSAPNAKVIRDGKKQSIPARLVVPEDIVELEAGDMICCDGVLLSSASLKCSEAPLTGESVPAEKDHTKIPPSGAPLAEQTNRVFSGCYVSYGRGTFRAEATGMNTEIGKIARMLADEEQGQTPLQQKLSRLGKILGFVAIGICAVIFFIGLWMKMNPAEIFMTAVSLAVAAIPEGLPAIVTIVLAMGVSKMVKKNAITRKLSAVETLGGASVICSDKTGTLTQNKMTLVSAFTENGVLEDMSAAGKQAEAKKLLTYATLCTDAALAQKKEPDNSTEDKTPSFTGDPTETAIVACAYENGIFKNELEAKSPRVSEIPFDSDRKRMTVIVKHEDGFLAIVKGAVDSLAPLCVSGPVDAALAAASQMAQKAQRVLAVAFRKLDALPPSVTPDTVEKDLTLLGLVSMIDPPRPEAFEAVKLCKNRRNPPGYDNRRPYRHRRRHCKRTWHFKSGTGRHYRRPTRADERGRI